MTPGAGTRHASSFEVNATRCEDPSDIDNPSYASRDSIAEKIGPASRKETAYTSAETKDLLLHSADGTSTRFSAQVSYLEIYNETIRDLFNPTPIAPTAAAASGGGELGGTGYGNAGSVMSSGGGLRLREDPRSLSVGLHSETWFLIMAGGWPDNGDITERRR